VSDDRPIDFDSTAFNELVDLESDLAPFSGLNDVEMSAYEIISIHARNIARGGWPDFLVQLFDSSANRDVIVGIEIKRRKATELSLGQLKMHRLLRDAGVEVFTITREQVKEFTQLIPVRGAFLTELRKIN
jgi:hypothetical protein